jgi:hypothetical protein
VSRLQVGIKEERERWVAVVRRRIAQHRDNLSCWQEPRGFLLPTEPDPDERSRIRECLTVAIEELGRLCEELGVSLEGETGMTDQISTMDDLKARLAALETQLADERAAYAEMRQVFGLLCEEVGLPQHDYLGVLRAVKGREGSGGKLTEIRAQLAQVGVLRSDGDIVQSVKDMIKTR